MPKQPSGPIEVHPLEILGISAVEERAYRFLLAHPGAALPEIAAAVSLSARAVQRLLDDLETKGLANHSSTQPLRYAAAPPDTAIEALLIERQLKLQYTRTTIQELNQHAAAARPTDHQQQPIESIATREATSQVFEQLHRMAKDEMIGMVRCPVVVTNVNDPADYEIQREAQARGVRYRSIVDSEFVTLPGAVRSIVADLLSGQEVRLLPVLPFKVFIADRKIALVVPSSMEGSGCRSLLVREPALLDAMCSLFALLWERALPVTAVDADTLKIGDQPASFSRDAGTLIPLLAAGLNDKAIAVELGISARTLDRRILDLMKTLEARTRFQAGWTAALRYAPRGEAQDET